MFEEAIKISDVSKMYRMFSSKRHQIMDLLGLPVPRSVANEFWALRDISLSIKKGEKVGLIGHNGAGKSTLLKIIAGQVRATSGVVKVSGKVQALMELGTGFHPEFTGRENVLSALSYQGIVGKFAKTKLDEIIEFSELEEFIDNPVKTYSAGMYARLAFSVATSIEPEILIVDEVLGAGDAYFAGKCVDRMNTITNDSGATVLFVSHDTSSILRLCSRVIWMKRGRPIMDGPAHDVVKEYVDAMRYETELRHRAREMQVDKGVVRSILNASDVYKKLVFRFVVPQPTPESLHFIKSIELERDNQTLASIAVGDVMDNSDKENNYLIVNPTSTCWSEPEYDKGEHGRYIARATANGQNYAPFVLSFPLYLEDELKNSKLIIKGDIAFQSGVHIELWDERSGYKGIGALAKVGDGLYSASLGIEVPEVDLELEKQVEVYPSHNNNEDEFSTERVVRIDKVDFINNQGASSRVFPQRSKLEVVVDFEATQKVKDPVFALTFHRLDGVQMDHQNSKLLEKSIGEIFGHGKVKFVFNPIRFGPGEYLVTIAILKFLDLDNWVDQPPSYDRHDRRYSLSIYSTMPSSKNLGAVIQECEFDAQQSQ
ncbi:ABC transporter ATP-binding protein [Neopusillimonas maritima]|uniref:ABC transporter domain-containing protein n=1 Tax=Neopusillimonas maritima TaxID=2026239 RepID=A0ABX9MWQ7_9BURK|nr:ABC transporter ATP-binding protein [Neopusillimonas maritima]RII83399.1 hypothetical protein CJO09_07315 [Neopusillimonas maritima]